MVFITLGGAAGSGKRLFCCVECLLTAELGGTLIVEVLVWIVLSAKIRQVFKNSKKIDLGSPSVILQPRPKNIHPRIATPT